MGKVKADDATQGVASSGALVLFPEEQACDFSCRQQSPPCIGLADSHKLHCSRGVE